MRSTVGISAVHGGEDVNFSKDFCRPQGRRKVPRLVEILGESWMDFSKRPQTRASASFSNFLRGTLPWGLGNVTVGFGERYRGGWGTLPWGAFGLLISHFPLAYSVAVQPMAASSASALRAVWRRFFIASALASSGQT